MEGWDLTLTVVGLGVASAAAVATLVDRYISGEWWWQRLKLPITRTQTAPGEFKPLPFAAETEEEHSRTWGCPRYTITPEEIVRRRREGSVLPTI
jgi:hypothetical protein